MPTLHTVDDASDPRLRDYVSLRDTQLRQHVEVEAGLFIAEGEKVIHRALDAGYVPRSLLLAERWWAGLSERLEGVDVDVYLADAALIEHVTGFHVHRGALGAFHRRQAYSTSKLLQARRLVVAEDIVDHTNVGAILRATAGLGWDGVMLSPRCADPLYRRSIKVSMGAVFSLPWARFDAHNTAIDSLKQAGFRVVALALRDDAVTLPEFAARLDPSEKVALLVGTEGDGLSNYWLERADDVVMIPMHAGIDSLNVAAALSVACYALSVPRGVMGQSSA